MATKPLVQNPAPDPGPPAPPPVQGPLVAWYHSQRFIALCQSTAIIILTWVSAALATNDWSWRTMAVAVIGNILLVLKDWWNPNIVAPFAALNENNVVVPPVGK